MESYHTNLIMPTNILSDTSTFHKLKHNWNLWAHLPQDTDWSVKSYKKIYQFKNVEETIAIIESCPENLSKNCMLFIM